MKVENMFNGVSHNFLMQTVKFALILSWAVLIVALMTTPLPVVESADKGFTVLDKIVHVFLFGILVWLTLDWRREWRSRLGLRAYVAVVVGGLLFAYGVEYLQHFIPGRNSSGYDLAFGLVGMLWATALFFYYSNPERSRGGGSFVATCKSFLDFCRYKKIRDCRAPLRCARNDKNSKPKLLLHLCCGPCGAQISEDLQKDYEITLLFANSNIDTKEEYKKRLAAAKTLAKHNKLPLLVEPYKHDEWSAVIRGFEDEPERGKRCVLCYRYRLAQTVDKCRHLGFDYYASSLSVSPYKDAQAVINIGRQLSVLSLRATAAGSAAISSKNKTPKFLDKNFNTHDGFRQSVAAAKRLGLYRQKYCGCEFSRRDKK